MAIGLEGGYHRRLSFPNALTRLPRVLGAMRNDLTDFSDVLSTIPDLVFIPGTQRHISGNVSPDGQSWGSKDAAYTARKGKEGYNRAALFRKGKIRQQVASGRGVKVTRNSVTWSIPSKYGTAVNYGSKGDKYQGLKFWGISDAMAEKAIRIITMDVKEKLSRAERKLNAGGTA